MSQRDAILRIAKQTIDIESKAIAELSNFLNGDFAKAVELILHSKGRVIITGIGKSAIIAQKIVATLNSTGTPAIFMHAADAIHGDLGLILKDDVVICISKSGNTPEIKVLVPLIKSSGNTLIAMTGNADSYLGNNAHFIFNTYVEQEACPNNLAPTTSTTAQLVLGDALAICLLELRGFSSMDFAKYHPGGALGKRLYLRVGDLALENQKPQVNVETDIKRVIVEISEKRLGMTVVLDKEKIVGIITDGDLRRMLSTNDNFADLKAADIMSKHPKTIEESAMAVDARHMMEAHNISQLIVVNGEAYAGVVHMHDLIKEGII